MAERNFKVSALLRHFNELQRVDDDSPGSDLTQVRLDIERALLEAPLTQEERTIVAALFLIDPIPPERREFGRPRGGSTHLAVADLILEGERSENARNIQVSRILNKACEKMAAFLGHGYEA